MLNKISSIQLVAMDVDGVLTDGRIIYSGSGEELKAFDIQDGLGIVVAGLAGLEIGIVTGRVSPAVERRAQELNIPHVYQGCLDKRKAIRSLLAKTGLSREQAAFIGDDINDVPAFEECGFRIAVSTACQEVKAMADYVTRRPGGRGAVREALELILDKQGKWDSAIQQFLRKVEESECPT